jgi:small conductance mechanosensitive channel
MILTKKSLLTIGTTTLITLLLQALFVTTSSAQSDNPLISQRKIILAKVDAQSARLDNLTLELQGKSGEEYLLILGQIGRLESGILELYDELADNVEASKAAGLDTTALGLFYEQQLIPATEYVIHLIEVTQRETQLLGEQRERVPRPELMAFEQRLAGYNNRVDHYFEILVEHADRLERLGLDGSVARNYVRNLLPARADRLMGRVAIAQEQILALEKRVEEGATDTDTAAELRAARAKLEWTTRSLGEATRVLDLIGYPTAAYRQVLIRTTGLTEAIFDAEVATGLIDDAIDNARDWLSDNGLTLLFKALIFVVIVMAFRFLGMLLGHLTTRGLQVSSLGSSRVLRNLLSTIVSRTVMLLGILFAISQLGIQIGPLLAGIGIVGFAVGFALQETLANFASGTMLLLYRPFDTGDIIDAGGVLGEVADLSLVNTTLLTFDNRRIIVPNNKIWGDIITNVTAMEARRVDISVRVAPTERVTDVEAALNGVVAADSRVLAEPEPLIRIHKLDDGAVEYIVRPWAKREDYWDVYWDLNRAIKLSFEERGIRLAFERRHTLLESDSG